MELILILLGVFVLVLTVLRRAEPVQPQIVYVYTPPAMQSESGSMGSALMVLIMVIIGAIWLLSA